MDKDLSLSIQNIMVNYFDSRKEVIINAIALDNNREKITFELPFDEDNVLLMKPKSIQWYIGNTKDFPITRSKHFSNGNLVSKLLGVFINFKKPKVDDEKYDVESYCNFYVGRSYPPAKRSEMLSRNEIHALIKGLIETFPQIFSRDEKFA